VCIGLVGVILMGLHEPSPSPTTITTTTIVLPPPPVPADSADGVSPTPPPDQDGEGRGEGGEKVQPPGPPPVPPPPPPPPDVPATVNCDTLQSDANTLYRNGQFQPAVDKLIACTELLPDDTVRCPCLLPLPSGQPPLPTSLHRSSQTIRFGALVSHHPLAANLPCQPACTEFLPDRRQHRIRSVWTGGCTRPCFWGSWCCWS
jgi:hypothetical protein